MERNNWSFVGPKEQQTSLHQTATSFRVIAERNQAKARRRYLRARRLTPLDDNGEVWGNGPHLDDPSADDCLPPEPSDSPLTLSGALSPPVVISDPRLTFSSLKRSGDTLGSGPTKERKKEERIPQDVGNVTAPDCSNQAGVRKMASLRRRGVTFVWHSFQGTFRTQLTHPRRVGRLTKIFMGATLRFPHFMNNRKLLVLMKWIP